MNNKKGFIASIIFIILVIIILGIMIQELMHRFNSKDFCKSNGFDTVNSDNYCITDYSISNLKVACKPTKLFKFDCHWENAKTVIDVRGSK
jgi:hypothetical protein